MNDFVSFAKALEQALDEDDRVTLARAPLGALRDLGIQVIATKLPGTTDECGCDGMYVSRPRPTIVYVPTPNSRRENFTLAHELGHHLIRANDAVNSALGDIGDDGGVEAEERVCDAFAGRILVPASVVNGVVAKRHPEARDVLELYARSSGSREACAVRLAERLPCFGYVTLLDPSDRSVRFAAASPHCSYRWTRGTRLSDRHPVWRAMASNGQFRGEGPIVWGGAKKNVWIDAVSARSVVIAVFASDRLWSGSGVSILGGTGPSRPRPTLLSGKCRHCGADSWGYRACDRCGDTWCKKCQRCGCGAASGERPQRTCPRCGLTRAISQFDRGSTLCRDCA